MSFNSANLKQQIELVCIERGLEVEEVIKAIEIAISSAYRKELGEKEKGYDAHFNIETGKYTLWETTTIVDEILFPEKEMTIMDAKLFNPNARVGDVIRKEISTDHDVEFGRIAAQVARQVLFQTINSTRHTKILSKYKDQIGQVVNVEIDYFKRGGYSVKVGQTNGFLSKENLLSIDRFKPGQIVKALIVDISEDDRGYSRIVLSRSSPDFVRSIIKKEIPEVASGAVLIDKIVRDPGSRTKILVSAMEGENIDPVGAILGQRNIRITNIMREISTTMQEKVDIIENRPEDFEGMVMDALEPAEIERVDVDYNENKADIYCLAEEAALAVGRRGVNIRLAGELLDIQLNIVTISQDEVVYRGPEIIA
jgi:transcription termination/antitermination protein NusA